LLKPIVENLANLEEEMTIELVEKAFAEGKSVQEVLDQCKQGMEIVGQRFDAGEYFLADMMLSADIFARVTEIAKNLLEEGKKTEGVGKVLLATVKNDIHYLGKNLVASMLRAFNFEVVDLGEDVEADVICAGIKEHRPDIVGFSCLLTIGFDSMEDTIKRIEEIGLRDSVKIIVGGAPVTESVAKQVGADAYGSDASDAVRKCLQLLGV